MDIGSRLELFVDDFLVASTTGDLGSYLHRPVPGKLAITCDKPWEGNTSAYFSVFHDGDLVRIYYRGHHCDGTNGNELHQPVTCYAQSNDGRTWKRPRVGLYSYDGSKNNNIVWEGEDASTFAVFRDDNPKCPGSARYKAVSQDGRGLGVALRAFQSPDGIHWKRIGSKPLLTRHKSARILWFDSQNLAFWDAEAGLYRVYFRANDKPMFRRIMTSTSRDFKTWTRFVDLSYPGSPRQELYTNAIQPYSRAPHILVGFPARYHSRSQQVEPLFMASRDGVTFTRYDEPVIPRSAPRDRNQNRSNYMTWGIVHPPGEPAKMLVYGTEAYYEGPGSRVRVFEYRVDGFVSIRARSRGGSLTTRTLTFSGKTLHLNVAARRGGSVRVELQNRLGRPIAGFAAADCEPLKGDSIDTAVTWKHGADLSAVAGKQVRIRFVMKNADLYALQFRG